MDLTPEELQPQIQEDIRRLDERRAGRPEEQLWATLAALGWIPPAAAEDFRRRLHELTEELKELRKT